MALWERVSHNKESKFYKGTFCKKVFKNLFNMNNLVIFVILIDKHPQVVQINAHTPSRDMKGSQNVFIVLHWDILGKL